MKDKKRENTIRCHYALLVYKAAQGEPEIIELPEECTLEDAKRWAWATYDPSWIDGHVSIEILADAGKSDNSDFEDFVSMLINSVRYIVDYGKWVEVHDIFEAIYGKNDHMKIREAGNDSWLVSLKWGSADITIATDKLEDTLALLPTPGEDIVHAALNYNINSL